MWAGTRHLRCAEPSPPGRALPEEKLCAHPWDDDLDRVDIVHQPGMRVDPSGLPLPAANMLEELNALKRHGLEAGPFEKAVFLATAELFMHRVRIMA